MDSNNPMDLPSKAFAASDFDHPELHYHYVANGLPWEMPHQPHQGPPDHSAEVIPAEHDMDPSATAIPVTTVGLHAMRQPFVYASQPHIISQQQQRQQQRQQQQHQHQHHQHQQQQLQQQQQMQQQHQQNQHFTLLDPSWNMQLRHASPVVTTTAPTATVFAHVDDPTLTGYDATFHDARPEPAFQDLPVLRATAMAFPHQPHFRQPLQQQPHHLPLDLATTTAMAQQQTVVAYTASMDGFKPLAYYQTTIQPGLPAYSMDAAAALVASSMATQPTVLCTSPSDPWADDNSASGSDGSWQNIDYPGSSSRQSFESYVEQAANPPAINPGLTLHIRTDSGSTNSDVPQSAHSFSSFEEIQWAMHSPESEAALDFASGPSLPITMSMPGSGHRPGPNSPVHSSSESSSPPARVVAIARRDASSSSTSPVSPTSSTSTTSRKRRDTTTTAPGKSTKAIIKKTINITKRDAAPDPNARRVGKRKGPLRPEQRKSASEIRKLRACLRCKFLKKTCDAGDPCTGCKPSHIRLWQVPCTRIDIKDIGYFMKNWKSDYERHVSLGNSVCNIQEYGISEKHIHVTHGFGHHLKVSAREVYVRDPSCFGTDWTESCHDKPNTFVTSTAQLAIGRQDIPNSILHFYLDQHLDRDFEGFVDKQFEGTPFFTEMLKTAYHYYQRTNLPIMRKALKLVIAYNLTQHITLCEAGLSPDEAEISKIDDETSSYYGWTLAPVMISFHIKQKFAMMWRELQKDVLDELSALYSSVYSGEKLKNWPTIFMLASLLLAVWEEMQFDAHYRSLDPVSVEKFCEDMESTPVGVIVGLFSAISQKVPGFLEWETEKHHQILNSDPAVCETMTEVRQHVEKHEEYLRSRSDCKYDRDDFDSLSNKFLSKLVLSSQPTKCH